jgi:signal transduction histidine kinase
LNAVLDNSLDQLLPQARNRDIRFELETIDDDLWVVGDAASLERVISNIVGNAIKYSPEGTLISIKLAVVESNAVLTVDDQGVGIDPAILDQLFTRFKRDSKTADSHKGIGLGLALVAQVVGLHGGHVKAASLDVGTRLTVTLPLEESSTQASLDYS